VVGARVRTEPLRLRDFSVPTTDAINGSPHKGYYGGRPPGWGLDTFRAFERARKFGLFLIFAQFVFYCIWSFWEYTHWALTWDFSSYYQAYWLLGRGDLNPWSTTLGMYFWQNHAEFIMWPLAFFSWLFPTPYSLLIIQDVGTSLTALVAFDWIIDYLRSRPPTRSVPPAWLAMVGAVIVVGNPWPLWSLAFDYHAETMAGLFVLLAARAFYKNARTKWLWSFVTVLTGDVGATYLAGIGISLALVNYRALDVRHWRQNLQWIKGLLTGVAIVGGAAIYLSVIHAVGGDQGSGLDAYAYLVANQHAGIPSHFTLTGLILGAITHPLNFLKVLWDRRYNLYANIAAPGLIGFFTPWGLGVPLVLEIENGLHSYAFFSVPGFQSEPMYGFVNFGTIVALASLARLVDRGALFHWRIDWRKWTKLARAAVLLIAANAIAWAVIWYPAAPAHWLRVPTSSAQVLDEIATKISPQDEVFVTQGVTGRFAGRQWTYPIMGAGAYGYSLMHDRNAWWVITPFVGTEMTATVVDLNMIAKIVTELHGKVVVAKNDVWALEIPAYSDAPRGQRQEVYFTMTPQILPAWTTRTTVGERVLTGPVDQWHMTAYSPPDRPVRGYVNWGDYYQALSGEFAAQVTLDAHVNGKVEVEAWNADTNVLLMRRSVPSTRGVQTFTFKFWLDPSQMKPEWVYKGWGPFTQTPIPPPAGNRVEIRVWTPGGGRVDVYKIGLLYLQNQFALT
jgi:uncharacterized membrane protein